jgi:hypothetical protein
LLDRGEQIWCVDNLRLGRRRNIAHLANLPAFRFVELDVLDQQVLVAIAAGLAMFLAFTTTLRGRKPWGGGRNAIRPKPCVTLSSASPPMAFDLG